MPKAVKVPTLDEIREYKRNFASDLSKPIDGKSEPAMLREMTERIFSVEMPDDVRLTAWKYCKELAKFAHAPVSPAEYKRAEKWLGETALIDVLLKACDGYYPNPAFKYSFDVIGYFYSIALISQSQYRRKDVLALLDKTVRHYVQANDLPSPLLRNMTKLEKQFPDLAPFKTALESIS